METKFNKLFKQIMN